MSEDKEENPNNPMRRRVGRPYFYDDSDEGAELFEKNIVSYFEDITNDDETYKLTGKLFRVNPTITGMMLHVGLSSKQTYYNYLKREKFVNAVERARLAIESSYEAMLYEKGSAGAIFALKNFGWEDRSTIEHGGEIQKVEINFSEPETKPEAKPED